MVFTVISPVMVIMVVIGDGDGVVTLGLAAISNACLPYVHILNVSEDNDR